MHSTEPLVSVVMAAYNRSNLLPLVVRTVQWQTLAEWELLIVGDACTDDTEAVARAFGDARIRFTNLDVNCGDQSGPNNEGMRLARGKYIAFLNHDDFWLPDHLEASVRALEERGADLVYSASLCVGEARGAVIHYSPSGVDDTRAQVQGSSWLFRRELRERIGGWRHHRQCYGVPSQEWLHRARQAGCRIAPHPTLSAVYLPSGYLDRAYARRAAEEHHQVYDKLAADPEAFRKAAAASSEWLPRDRMGSGPIRRAVIFVIYRCFDIAAKLGLRIPEPPGVYFTLVLDGRWPTKGAIMQALREKRGLPRWK